MLSLFLTIVRLLKAISRSWSIPEFRAALALAGLILASGTVFYHSVEGWGWLDSLYFCVATMSTAGYGDLTPRTDIGKLFTIVYIFVGVGIFVAIFAQLARALIGIGKPDNDGSTE